MSDTIRWTWTLWRPDLFEIPTQHLPTLIKMGQDFRHDSPLDVVEAAIATDHADPLELVAVMRVWQEVLAVEEQTGLSINPVEEAQRMLALVPATPPRTVPEPRYAR